MSTMSRSDGARLAYVGLVVSDVAAATNVLAKDLGLPRTDCPGGNRIVPVVTIGESALALFAPDDPAVGGNAKPGVHHIALRVKTLDDATALATARGIATAEADALGLQARRRILLSPAATCGVHVYLSEPLAIERSARDGAVERIDHIGVASADNDAAIDVFCNRLGFPLESTQTDLETSIAVESFTSDKYGVVQHARQPELRGGLRVSFITVGDCELEFLQDFDPRRSATAGHEGPGTTKRDQSAIARYVDARGAGLHHIALKVRDIDGTLTALARAGHPVIDRVGRPGSCADRVLASARAARGARAPRPAGRDQFFVRRSKTLRRSCSCSSTFC